MPPAISDRLAAVDRAYQPGLPRRGESFRAHATRTGRSATNATILGLGMFDRLTAITLANPLGRMFNVALSKRYTTSGGP